MLLLATAGSRATLSGFASLLGEFRFFGELLHPALFAGLLVGLQFGLGHFLHEPGLRDGKDVLRRPVEGESGGKVVTEEEKDERHQHEDALLHFVSGLRSDLHLQDHRDGHEEGKGVDGETHDVGDGVGLGEIGDPPEEGLVAELDGILEHGEEAEEDGDLQEHGKATAHRVDSELAIELHCLLIHLVRIVGILLLELGHLGLELRHPLHGAGGLGVQGPHQGADNESQDDHGPSPGPIVALAAEEGWRVC